MGAARLGRVDQPRAAIERLTALESGATGAGEALFAANIRILRLEVGAWLAWVRQRSDSSVALMNEAAALEMATPKHAVTPAPTLPAHELLGDLLLAQGRAADALAAYRRALTLYPRRYRSLLGAARAARAAGEEALSGAFYREILEVAGTSDRPGVAEARR
jgi:tetratricopeptide (TPR) repeat protein